MSSSLLNHNPFFISSSITASYFLFYTAYDKSKKKLVFSNLVDLFFFRKGLDWTLVELNKALSLSGLTTMLISFLPNVEKKNKDSLLWISMNLLWAHSVYSFYKFYSFNPKRLLKEKTIKRLSVAFGSLGQLILSLGYFGQISYLNLILSATTLGIAHFWTMEVDYKYKLQVRPYAYIPFPLAGLAIGLAIYNSNK